MEKSLLEKIGERIKLLRINKGYSSYESFSFDYDLPRMQYWRLESGKANLTIKTLEKILKIHNISVQEFFNDNSFKLKK